MKAITELVIDRSKWKRGSPNDDETLLLAEDGKMCCLGFYALACGAGEDEIRNVYEPDGLEFYIPGLSEEVDEEAGIYNTFFTQNAIPINDSPHMGDLEREKELTKLFKEEGIDLTFEG